ncbi:MAG TPA: sulfatase-like hydrolase/transferase [Thermoanaerobaculia bacterium]|nr:sulfatase-like hydrolase/transferase [Thermoanaerobaculia bacterium]
MIRRFRLTVLSLVLVAVTACGRADEGFHLLPLVAAKSYAVAADETPEGLSFPRAPELRELEIDHEERPVVLTSAAAPWRWRGHIPPGARLNAGVQTFPVAWKAVRALRVTVSARDGRTREILEVASTTERAEPRWLDLEVDLSRFAGREITLEMAATLEGLPAARREDNVVAWGPVLLSSPPERAEEHPPNVLFILVDTLRHDHLTPYGYTRHDTSPEIKRWLADPGVVVENAYSQAPWTLPSVISFMTGRYPGELVGSDLAAFGIPQDVKPLAERMTGLGYHTGGFVANPTLHAGAGFGRGFRTYFAPPADIEWLGRHADDVNRHALPWLRAFQRRPFFLYVHYIDPHDPYENPDMIDGRAFFMPGYRGPVAGGWIHGIYTGGLEVPDPARDIPYIEALYDGEIRYVDRHIGALLAALDPEVLQNTLIVLTSDHGEELHDHGGWKHGQTLYEEQIHVPLIFRWDGRIKAGTRLSGTAQLLDLVPTLTAGAGGEADASWDGINLLPALMGKAALPRRPAFAEGLSGGPLRAAAVLDGRKLVLFNREEPFRPGDGLQEHLWKLDLGRLRRAELYDLTKDPGERRDLAGTDPQGVGGLAPVIHDQLALELPGLWVLQEGPAGLPAGTRLSGSIVFERPPSGWSPYFLGSEDRVELAGTRLRFDLTGAPGGKGLRVDGDFGRIAVVEASLDGRPLPPGGVRLGANAAYSGGTVAPAVLRSPRWPLTGSGSTGSAARLRLWMYDGSGAVDRRTTADPETEKGLRSLGYIQ